MKIGIVNFLNTRPLVFGFQHSHPGHDGQPLTLVEGTPARLFEQLNSGLLDAALISSVQILRHGNTLDYCDKVGVCARSRVRSIIYIEEKGNSRDPGILPPPKLVYSDNGSRTSEALLQLLFLKNRGHRVQTVSRAPEEIPGLIGPAAGGLLIGDSALRFQESDHPSLATRDLAEWWHEEERLPFVFALWAYPRNCPLPDSLFEKSLDEGLNNLESIITDSPFSQSRSYLKELLHFHLDDEDRLSLRRFGDLLQEYGLMSD